MSDQQSVTDIFRPVTDLFSQQQLQMMLLAWLPLKMSGILQTDVYVVDMFITTVVSSLIVALLAVTGKYGSKILAWFKSGPEVGTISIQVNYYRIGYWGEDIVNSHYTSLAWMVSRAACGLNSGDFILMPNPDYDSDDTMLEFSLLPQYTSQCWVEYKNAKYHVRFDQTNTASNDSDGKAKKSAPPAIIISTSPDDVRNVNWATEFMTSVSEEHREYEKSKKERGRWELDSNGNWFYVLKQHSNRGLESVALTKEHETELNRDLNTFLADREFYTRVGLPYRRGYLFHGKPGTGKTSLINAISAQLNRDVYYMNLCNIKSDSMLQSAFSRVPPNQVIVFEDIDAMSRVCHRRDRNPLKALSSDSDKPEAGNKASSSEKDGELSNIISTSILSGPSMLQGPFTLSCMLNCLDGHILNDGIITVMTSNHPEKLDPALIRAGRIDLNLKLDYVDRYQVQRMYQLVVTDDDAKHPPLDQDWLSNFPEFIVPPCECMRVMILFRREAHLIPGELDNLVRKYQNGEIDPELVMKDEEGYVGSDNGQENSASAEASASAVTPAEPVKSTETTETTETSKENSSTNSDTEKSVDDKTATELIAAESTTTTTKVLPETTDITKTDDVPRAPLITSTEVVDDTTTTTTITTTTVEPTEA
ncbi:hypothetical protein BDF19DRAFT_423420 [Syncephalis fuscata]|nr:hypothetical protein BDF19DRAFT_423420 [Syncephalis fuscata]